MRVVLLALLVQQARPHRCAYRPPPPEDVIVGSRPAPRLRLSRSLHDRFHIHTVFDETVTKDLSSSLSAHIQEFLIPHAIEYWTANIRLKGGGINGIALERACVGRQEARTERRRICPKGCALETKCGEAVIPEMHLHKCATQRIPTTNSIQDEENLTTKLTMTNFILYITAVNSTRCSDLATVAYAVHCQQDYTKRPIAGNVNLCPASLSERPHDQELLVSTIKHEIAHALVFSDALFVHFPQEEVRKHFNCSELLGAELEDQGGYGTSMVHWEKRLFENEAMTGTHTQNPVYSRITLALFEDSGWYEVDYDASEPFHYGRNLGCDFATLTCGEWMQKRAAQNLSVMPFCQQPKHDGVRSLAVTSCSSERNALAFCNLVPYEAPLVPYYQYFEELDGIPDAAVGHYGGSVELADFCPFYQAFAWRDPHADQPFYRDSRCELEINTPLLENNPVMELYGNNSKCFDLAVSWTEKKCSRVKTFSQYGAGCYEFVCEDGRPHVRVANSDLLYTCYYEGQHIHIRQVVNGWLREGVLICPACAELCDDCAPDFDPELRIGDPPMHEPCAAHSRRPNPFFHLFLALLTTQSVRFQYE